MQFDEFADCIKWFHPIDKRKSSDHAWSVKATDVLKYDKDNNLLSANLDLKNPSGVEDVQRLPPDQLASNILQKEGRIVEILEEIKAKLGEVSK